MKVPTPNQLVDSKFSINSEIFKKNYLLCEKNNRFMPCIIAFVFELNNFKTSKLPKLEGS